ncbi:MAG TPA: hypothetical protein VL418_12095 [Devosiaceae bacterium]|nr:hypothetical protein [Devosiaceae bacterium]
MRIFHFPLNIALAIGLSLSVAAPAAYAQTASSITCGEFAQMSSAAQNAALKRVASTVPTSSTPKSAGELVAACQAVSAGTTVRSAWMRALPRNSQQ